MRAARGDHQRDPARRRFADDPFRFSRRPREIPDGCGDGHYQYIVQPPAQYIHRSVRDTYTADLDCEHLRHEFPPHARARLVLRLSARAADDGIGCGRTYSLSET